MSDTTRRRPEDEEIKRRVLEQLDALDAEGKRKVLDFSRELSGRKVSEVRPPRPVKDTGGALLAFAGTIPAEDLEEIRRAVEEDCEKIDEEGWKPKALARRAS